MKVFHISADAVKSMIDSFLESPNQETGGVLIGCLDESNEPSAFFAMPCQADVQSELTFQPNKNFVQGAIFSVLHITDGGMGYMGLWHTHPTGNPNPSPRDKEALLEMHKHSVENDLPSPYMVIATMQNGTAIITAWGIIDNQFQQLKALEFDDFEMTISSRKSKRIIS